MRIINYSGAMLAVILLSDLQVTTAQVCTCDLTEKACDPNCCCDSDCTSADKDSFTMCLNADANQDDRVCISDDILLFNNVKFRTQGTGKGLFCIYKDNFSERNFYTTVQTATAENTFETLASKYRKSSFQPALPEPAPFTSSSTYKVGDKVLLLFESNVPGYLALPKAVTLSNCNDQNPAGFLQNEISSCSRIITDLPSQCLSDRSLDAQSYYTGFKMAPNPAFFATLVLKNDSTVSPTSSAVSQSSSISSRASSVQPTSSFSVQSASPIMSSVSSNATADSSVLTATPTPGVTTTIVRPVYTSMALFDVNNTQPMLCQNDQGVTAPCTFITPPKPSYDFVNNVCRNVVLKTSYSISYIENISLSLSAASVSFTFGNIKAGIKSFRQQFSVKFQKNGTSNVLRRSGNPGYIPGQPILAGNLVQNQPLRKEAIQLSLDTSKWLTIIRPAADGSCVNSTRRASVTFGRDLRTGCYVNIKRTMTVAECVNLQNIIHNTMLKDLPTHVGMFGNSAVTNTADWIKIIDVKPTNTPSLLNGQCQNMILGSQIEILHSNTGFLANPQQRIVGVRIKYEASQHISYQCSGPYCQPHSSDLTQQIEIVQSVSFIDVSATLEAKQKSKPDFASKAPYDFFYPFL